MRIRLAGDERWIAIEDAGRYRDAMGVAPPVGVPDDFLAVTSDPLGPLGAKSMSEAPYNPVAPAVANAVRDAVGVRPYRLPMTRDRVWALLQDAAVDRTDAGGA